MAKTKKNIIKKYSNGEITIVWQPELCIHSGECFTGLPDVFMPGIRPWIRPKNAETKKIIIQVKKCPSGALTYFFNEKSDR